MNESEYAQQWAKASKQLEKKYPATPVIKCLPRAIMNNHKDGMKFWCPFCKQWHYHGRGDGLRCAHCCDTLDSRCYEKSFNESGYIIKMMSKAELKQIKKEIDAYLSEQKNKKEVEKKWILK